MGDVHDGAQIGEDFDLLGQARFPHCPPVRFPHDIDLEKLLSDREILVHQLNENEHKIMALIHKINWSKP